jgi:DNA-directed RNA polymerase subunit RPC12/RpoP
MEELFKLVALVDLSSPENLKAFEDWKANDGSKEGLLKLKGDWQPEFEHELTDEVVCPHCGYEHQDSFEFSDYGESECGDCGETFWHEREITYTYATRKI